MSIYMITAGEIQFVQDLVEELCSLADPSEYYHREVSDALSLLENLKSYDTQHVVDYFEVYNQSIIEGEYYERTDD